MKKTYYITTTLPYVNADPHIGFALEIVQADTLARYKRQTGFEVFFNFGTDEHGLKIFRQAKKAKKTPKDYVEEYAKRFKKLKKVLNLSYTNFVRTTEANHKKAAKAFWLKCLKNGDIYKRNYKVKYCVGCELEKTDSELENNRCPIHPNLDLEIIEEENYFFRFSKYQKKLLRLYEENLDFVIPKSRQKEINNFVRKGITDFSISRLKLKMPWGIDVPNDKYHVMYVWFDALINYISSIGWPDNPDKFNKWWPVVQVAGKDNLRQQSAIWQAMLLSAGLKSSKQIFIHGFITNNGQKMSKSLGNVVNPFELVKKYGSDAVRYYLLREIPSYKDGDFSSRRFIEIYNSDLANGLGNLISRVAKLSEKISFSQNNNLTMSDNIVKELDFYRFDKALELIWLRITKLDKYINDNKPWQIKNKKKLKKILKKAVFDIRQITCDLKPFLPETASRIEDQFNRAKIISDKPLFPRISK